MNDIEKLKKEFIIEDIAEYWKEKITLFGSIMRGWAKKGVTVAVSNGEVVAIYGAEELGTEQKHEVASATEGYLFAEGQYECANDANQKESESGGKE